MLNNKQMQERGYSGAFRVCFDLLAKYADAVDDAATWEQCRMEFVETFRRYEDNPAFPLFDRLLAATYTELRRLSDGGQKTQAESRTKPEGGKYRFTLP